MRIYICARPFQGPQGETQGAKLYPLHLRDAMTAQLSDCVTQRRHRQASARRNDGTGKHARDATTAHASIRMVDVETKSKNPSTVHGAKTTATTGGLEKLPHYKLISPWRNNLTRPEHFPMGYNPADAIPTRKELRNLCKSHPLCNQFKSHLLSNQYKSNPLCNLF